MPDGGPLTILAEEVAIGPALGADAEAGPLCPPVGDRRRLRHGRRDARTRDRALLFDQGIRAAAPASACRWSTASPRSWAAAFALTSAPGEGTRVDLYLPVADERRSRAAARRPMALGA